jgi:trk system potassium uptake protein TrkH
MSTDKEYLNKLKKDRIEPAQVLVAGFMIIILIGTFLLNLPMASKSSNSIGLLNAFFTSTSAVCVTGLAVVDTISHWSSFGHTVIFILIQIGSLGFMSMTTLFFLFSGKRITLRERVILQSFINYNKLSGVVKFIKYLLIYTIIAQGIGTILLTFRFIPIYGLSKGLGLSAFYANSAFSNSGFDFIGDFPSLMPFTSDLIINITTMFLIIIGGLGFSVILDIQEHKTRFYRLSSHSKLVLTMTIGLIFLGALVLFVLEHNNPETLGELSFQGKVISSFFQSVAPRTAGFYTIDINLMTTASKFFIIVLMFIGGSPGSTAAGIKTATIGILFAAVISVLRGEKDTELFKRRIPEVIIKKALVVVLMAIFIVITITMILTTTEKAAFMEILFEVVSAFGTVGLSLGITSELSTIGKVAIIFTMFIGRLGPLTIGFAISRKQLQNDKKHFRYPKDNIMVG